jgi:hypothetical protein
MSSDETKHTVFLTLRLPPPLAADLKRAALKEANPLSAVARRLIRAGLSREERLTQRESEPQR